MAYLRSGVFLLFTTCLNAEAAFAQSYYNDEVRQEALVAETVIVTGELSGFGATKSATPILETSRSISVESEDLFRAKGALSLDDTLNYTAGAVGDVFGFVTRTDAPSIRGFDGLEYRDGQQVLIGFNNNTRTDVYMLEQVEILKGPASVLFGKGTPGGIVNAISKLAREDAENEVIADIGNNDRLQFAFDLSSKVGDNINGRIVGLVRESDTVVDSVNDDAKIIMPSLTFDNRTTRLTAMMEYAERDTRVGLQFLPLEVTGCVDSQVTIEPKADVCRDVPGQRARPQTYLGDPEIDGVSQESFLVSLLASHQFTDRLSVDGIFRFKDGESTTLELYSVFPGAGISRVDANGDAAREAFGTFNTSEQYALDVRARWEVDTGPLNHELFGGIAYQDVALTSVGVFETGFGNVNVLDPSDITPTPAILADVSTYSDFGSEDIQDFGLYLNNQISVGRFRINLGVRYDDTETKTSSETQTDDAVSLSAGLLYAFGNGLSPYINYAESFQPVIGTDGITNIPLKPQEGKQVEVGLKYQPKGTPTYLTAAYYSVEVTNLENPQSLATQPGSQQEGVSEGQGFEFEAQTNIDEFFIEANLSWIDLETPDGVPQSGIPKTQASLWLQYEPNEKWFRNARVGFGIRYLGETESNALDSPIGPIRVSTSGSLVADALIAYTYDDWDLSLNIRNLADNEYFTQCRAFGDCFYGEPRTIVWRLGKRL